MTPSWHRDLGLRLVDVPQERYPDRVVYWRARALRILMLVSVGTMLVMLAALFAGHAAAASPKRYQVLAILVSCAFSLLLYWLAGRGKAGMALAGLLGIPVLLVGMTLSALRGQGILDPAVTSYFSAVVLAALLLDQRGLLLTAGASMLCLFALGYASETGRFLSVRPPLTTIQLRTFTSTLIDSVFFITVLLFLSRQIHRRLTEAAVESAREKEESNARAAALQELDRAKTTFFGNISHEFRTPLTLALGATEEALADTGAPLPPDQRDRVQMVRRNNLRLLRLVNTLLEFASLEDGRAQALFEPVDLCAFTADLASEFRAAIERAGLRLVVDCAALQAPAPVYVDRAMWEKIVLNLLSNALKFTHRGEIAVLLKKAGPAIELTVRDTGVGIPAEELPNLFQRFHRLRTPAARTHEGTGIGLALTQELVRLHGGTIQVASTPGRGSTFTVRIPAGSEHLPKEQIGTRSLQSATLGAAPYVEEALRWLPPARVGGKSHVLKETDSGHDLRGEPGWAAEEQIPAEEHPTPSGREVPRILVVDDNADMRAYLGRLLGQRWAVTSVADGKAALHSLRRYVPDLVLSDIMMPGLSGLELLQAIRADPRTCSVPVVLVSARAAEEAAIEGLRAGADDYLVKPFSSRELLARVGAHLELARLRRETAKSHEEFVRIVSHEIRGPLSVLKGYSHLARLQTERDGACDVSYFTRMERAIKRMETLADDLIDVVRIESGKMTLNRQPCDLAELCRQVADEQEIVNDREVLVELPETPVMVEADPGRICQVLANLLTNAFKYSAEDRVVRLSLCKNPGEAVFAVRDQGTGIPKERLPYIFERFYRVPGVKVHRSAGVGLGLGLFICQELVVLHGGRIWVESVVDKGSTFSVALPLPAAAAIASEDRQPA